MTIFCQSVWVESLLLPHYLSVVWLKHIDVRLKHLPDWKAFTSLSKLNSWVEWRCVWSRGLLLIGPSDGFNPSVAFSLQHVLCILTWNMSLPFSPPSCEITLFFSSSQIISTCQISPQLQCSHGLVCSLLSSLWHQTLHLQMHDSGRWQLLSGRHLSS